MRSLNRGDETEGFNFLLIRPGEYLKCSIYALTSHFALDGYVNAGAGRRQLKPQDIYCR